MWKYLNKGISTPIAIGIILTLAIIVGGCAILQYSDMQKEKNQITEIKKEIDEIADWQIYRNEEYGFEFKYPRGWSKNIYNGLYKNTLNGVFCFNPDKDYCPETNVGDFSEEFKESFIVYIFPISSKEKPTPLLSFNDYIKEMDKALELSDAYGLISKRELSINGINAIEYIIQYPEENNVPIPWRGQKMIIIYMSKDSEIFQIFALESTKDIFTKITSTFRFFEKEITLNETAEWKTYKNLSMNFSIKYDPFKWAWKEYEFPETYSSINPDLHEKSLGMELYYEENPYSCFIDFIKSTPYSTYTAEVPTFEDLVKSEKEGVERSIEKIIKESINMGVIKEVTEEEITVDGVSAVELSYIVSTKVHRIFIPLSGNETFQIGSYGNCDFEFYQMLSTFKFLE